MRATAQVKEGVGSLKGSPSPLRYVLYPAPLRPRAEGLKVKGRREGDEAGEASAEGAR